MWQPSSIPLGPFGQLGEAAGQASQSLAQWVPLIQQAVEEKRNQARQRSADIIARFNLQMQLNPNMSIDQQRTARAQLETDLQNTGDPAYINFTLPRDQPPLGPAQAPAAAPIQPNPFLRAGVGGTPASQVPAMGPTPPPPQPTPSPDPFTRAGLGRAITTPRLAPGETPPPQTPQISVPPLSPGQQTISDYYGPQLIEQLVSMGWNRDKISSLRLADVPTIPGLSDAIPLAQATLQVNAPTPAQPPAAPAQPAAAAAAPAYGTRGMTGTELPTAVQPPAPSAAGPQAAAPAAPAAAAAPAAPTVIAPTRRTQPYTGPIRTKGDVARRMGYSDEFASQFDSVPITNYYSGGRIDVNKAQQEVTNDVRTAITEQGELERQGREAATEKRTKGAALRKFFVDKLTAALLPGAKPLDWKTFGQQIADADREYGGFNPQEIMMEATTAAGQVALRTPITVNVDGQNVPMAPDAYVAHVDRQANAAATETRANAAIDRAAKQRDETTWVINGKRYTAQGIKIARADGILTDAQIKAVIPNYVPPASTDVMSPLDKQVLGAHLRALAGATGTQKAAELAAINKILKKYGQDPITGIPTTQTAPVDQQKPFSWTDPSTWPGAVARHLGGGGQQAVAGGVPAGAKVAPQGAVPENPGAYAQKYVQNPKTKQWYWSNGSQWFTVPQGPAGQ
jgi:hypothetical protein